MVKNMRTSSVTSWILDWPFVLSFLIVLIFINWTAAVITAIFMIILNRIITWKTNLNLTQDSMSSVEILITGLLTLTIYCHWSINDYARAIRYWNFNWF